MFGVLNLDGRPVAIGDLERMSNALAHRGPDRRKLWVDGPIGLGHGLMRITEEDRLEAQPLHDRETGVVLVADMRLDNREALAEAFGIAASDLRALPDSALLMRAYQRWGDDCATQLLGDFAFAIWDPRERRLLLGRDHLGQRACLFHMGERSFVFASEIKALWTQPEAPRKLSEAGIARLLTRDQSPRQGMTEFETIEGVMGAHLVMIGADGSRSSRAYWSPRADPVHEGRDEAYYVKAYRAVLSEAVACRMRRATAPVSLLLSGGYDSSAIAALAGPVATERGRRLLAVSSVMREDYRGDIRHGRKWVEMCRRVMPHLDVRYVTREGAGLLSKLEMNFLQDDGRPNAYQLVRRALYEAAAGAGARVVMDGYGGDQTLNRRGQATLARLLATGRLARFMREFRGHRRATGQTAIDILKRDVLAVLLPSGVMRAWRRLRHGPVPPWEDAPVQPAFARRAAAAGWVRLESFQARMRSPIDSKAHMLRALERRMAAPGSTALAAAHGLEPTSPFYDRRVVELALAIPPDLEVKDGRNRYLACRALADLYPPEFQTRSRMNDDQIPDFQRMAKAAEPEILREIERMERSEQLASLVDFQKIRDLLARRGPDDHNSGWEEDTQLAIGAFITARFINWFSGANR